MVEQSQIRRYKIGECVSFRKTNEPFGGLSNMAGGFPLRVNGVLIHSSEALYQACRFPHLPDIQQLILREKSPMTAKMVSKPHRHRSRKDWDRIRVRVMRWVIRVKLAMHWDKFSQLLLATESRAIVEDSRRDDFWGALHRGEDSLVGMNVLGRLLMELREELKGANRESLRVVAPADIPDCLLLGEPIREVGFPAKGVVREDPDLRSATQKLWQMDFGDLPEKMNGDVNEAVSEGSVPHEPAARGEQPQPRNAMSPGDLVREPAASCPPIVKRLIEVDLPIRRLSMSARREKSIGHISSLHIWWARRPLAACRAVVAAALWPDPADQMCSEQFVSEVGILLRNWSKQNLGLASAESYPIFNSLASNTASHLPRDLVRNGLLAFIADFADWGNSTRSEFLALSSEVSSLAAKALSGGTSETFLVLDPFAGGGSIPVECLRVGADAYASDLNPIPYLLNKALIEYIPTYGESLWERVEKTGREIGKAVQEQLAGLRKETRRSQEIACIWAKTVVCAGPGCGASIPILRSLWLEKNGAKKSALVLFPQTQGGSRSVGIEIESPPKHSTGGTVRRSSVTCPCCGYTISRGEMERLAKNGELGERMVALVETTPGQSGRRYRVPDAEDLARFAEAAAILKSLGREYVDDIPLLPDEELPYLRSIFNVHVYGVTRWRELFNERQLTTALLFVKALREQGVRLGKEISEDEAKATMLLLAFAVDRQINALNRTCYWNASGPKMQAGFARQALPMFWDYCEANPFGGSVGSWESMIKCIRSSFDTVKTLSGTGTAELCSATAHVLPDDSVDAVVTDPPYYDAVPYADLSDFFYVWLKRMLRNSFPEAFAGVLSPKELEVVQLAERNAKYSYKTKDNFERLMTEAMAEARRVAKPNSVSVVVFAHQTTAGWETMLGALIKAGWIVTASWPIDTEMPTRVRAQNAAALASSIHLACRPRESASGQIVNRVGDWRDVLGELPVRIKAWLPRLSAEGVVGADAIFACLGQPWRYFRSIRLLRRPAVTRSSCASTWSKSGRRSRGRR
jgi:ribA/ribD-fused uncharacterized protein